jgi:hypothetical protein
MSKEGTDYELPIGTEKISWIFAPIYNGTPSVLEWYLDFGIDTCVECSSWDMSQIQYVIYNYSTSTWTTIDASDCHFFYGDFDGNKAYIGHLNRQLFYYELTSSITNYISDDGYVKVGIDFAFSTSTRESEIHAVAGGTSTQSYVNRPAIIRTFYNAVIIR